MNVTYLIGNGFDIGLGLKTRYSDFLSKYVSRNYTSGPVKWLIEQIKNAPLETWANAEAAFGQLPFSESGFDINKTIEEVVTDFQKELAYHLGSESRRLDITYELRGEVRDRFLGRLIRSMLLVHSESARQEILSELVLTGFNVNVINFNYTDSVAKMLGAVSFPYESATVKIENGIKARDVKVTLHPMCYVHGNLSERSSIFGVDESYQIADEAARRYCEKNGQLLKTEVDRLLDHGFESLAKQMINKSDWIVCFGLSFGKTDLRWWDCIYNALFQNKDSRLLIHPYFNENKACDSGADQLSIATEVRDSFLAPLRAIKESFAEDLPGIDRVLPRIVVAKHYPHYDFDNKVHYCDPLCLKWFGEKYVKGFDR